MPSDVWRLDLPSREKIVLLALLDYGPRAFPSQAALARKCGMSVRVVQRAVEMLRRDNLVATKSRGKALTYSVRLADQIRQVDVSDTSDWRRDPNSPIELTQPIKGGEDSAGELAEQIANRHPSADVKAQRKVCTRTLEQHQLPPEQRDEAFCILLRHWHRTGTDAYSTLSRLQSDLAGARDTARLLMFKIRGLE